MRAARQTERLARKARALRSQRMLAHEGTSDEMPDTIPDDTPGTIPDDTSGTIPDSAVEVPASELAPETLRNLAEEFVTRDGTDAFDAEAKVRTVERLLERGEVVLWFDEETGSCNILPA